MNTETNTESCLLTIGTHNRLAGIRVVLESFARHHPGARLFAVLADRVKGVRPEFDVPVTVIHADELSLPGGKRFLFKYTAFELCCALKPYAVRDLIDRHAVKKLVYLDSDILVLNSFWNVLEDEWQRGSVLLTPHCLEISADTDSEKQVKIAQHGAYNAGFLGLEAGPGAEEFLKWWACVLKSRCLEDTPAGIYVDQRWLDVAVSRFSSIAPVRNPGFNVGYWNIFERNPVPDRQSGWSCRGEPLRFFHFSGFDRHKLTSKADIDNDVAPAIARLYAAELSKAGAAESGSLPYGWSCYESGEPIAAAHRDAILSERADFAGIQDPFSLPSNRREWRRLRAVAADIVPVRAIHQIERLERQVAVLKADFPRLRRFIYNFKRGPVSRQLWRLYEAGFRRGSRAAVGQGTQNSEERSIAIVYDWVPYPARSGDNRRVGEMIRVLRDNGWQVHLVITSLIGKSTRKLCLEHVDAVHSYVGRNVFKYAFKLVVNRVDGVLHALRFPPLRDIVSKLLGRKRGVATGLFSRLPSYPAGLDAYLERLQQQHGWHAVVVEYLWLHPAIGRIPKTVLRIMDTIDLWHKRNEDFESRGLKAPITVTRDEEAAILNRFDAVIAIQRNEGREIRRMCPGLKVLDIGISAQPQHVPPGESVSGRLLYVGGANEANIDGLRAFLYRIWPEIRKACPKAELKVCGHIYQPFLAETHEGVEFLGHVDDLEEEYTRAELVINPIWIGSGLKIKTVEAIVRSKPLVTTAKGIEGMAGAVEKACVVAGDEAAFARAVIGLLRDEERRNALARNSEEYTAVNLSPSAVYGGFLEFLDGRTPRDT